MVEQIHTFKIMYNPENLDKLRSLFGDFYILKVVRVAIENVLIMQFHKGKLIRSAKVPLRSGMCIDTVDDIKTYLLECVLNS